MNKFGNWPIGHTNLFHSYLINQKKLVIIANVLQQLTTFYGLASLSYPPQQWPV